MFVLTMCVEKYAKTQIVLFYSINKKVAF